MLAMLRLQLLQGVLRCKIIVHLLLFVVTRWWRVFTVLFRKRKSKLRIKCMLLSRCAMLVSFQSTADTHDNVLSIRAWWGDGVAGMKIYIRVTNHHDPTFRNASAMVYVAFITFLCQHHWRYCYECQSGNRGSTWGLRVHFCSLHHWVYWQSLLSTLYMIMHTCIAHRSMPP